MGKKIALAILLLLVVGGSVLQNIYVSGATEKLMASLEKIETALKRDDLSAAAAAADKFSTEWEKEQSLFEALFEHDEVDSISACVKSLQSYCRTGFREEALADVSETKFYINHIKEIDTLGWENIL